MILYKKPCLDKLKYSSIINQVNLGSFGILPQYLHPVVHVSVQLSLAVIQRAAWAAVASWAQPAQTRLPAQAGRLAGICCPFLDTIHPMA
ncbi:MAG TPA: hypothetical protein VFA64_08980 [Hyphomicrobiaceae bacterium]|nr:hypothetical protein [Hyphomicrobiaceae bacterium]